MKAKTRFAARREVIRRAFGRLEWGSLALGFAIGVLFDTFLKLIGPDQVQDFLPNLVPEAIGITFTVFILDRFDNLREQRQRLEGFVRRAHSRYNHTALEAIEELRVEDLLSKGTLAGKQLRGANWRDANLYQADLRGTDLRNADLSQADLVQANLEGANLDTGQLVKCKIMWQAIMPDGSLYDGRYNLPGDFELALRQGVDVGSPEEMAEHFGVSYKDYLDGQDWARDHLERLRQRVSSTRS